MKRLEVSPNGREADTELARDLPVSESEGSQLRDLGLALGQLAHTPEARPGGRARHQGNPYSQPPSGPTLEDMRAAVGRPGIRGRDEELAALARFLDGVPGDAAGLVIEGEAGIGKTTLWREARDDAVARGYLVLSCAAVEAEVSLPFVGLADLLAPLLDGALPALPAVQREALETALLRIEPSGDGAGEAAVSAAVLGVLRDARRPLVMAVDDVQWLDRHSARALAFAIRRLEAAAILVSRRVGPASSPELDRVLAELAVEWLPIGPLSIFALDALLREQLGLELERPRLRELHRVTDGNPLYAREIARESLRTGSSDLTVPRTLGELLRQRVRAASPAARRLLLLAAELGDPNLDVLTALGVPDDAFGELAARDIAVAGSGRLRLTHPLLAAAVRDETPTSQMVELHRFLAERLDDDVERALHLALASHEPDGRVAERLENAAARADARGAQETALALVEDAIRLTCEEGEAVWRRMLQRAYHLGRIGDVPRQRGQLEDLLQCVPPGRLRARALCELSIVDEFHGLDHARVALAEPDVDLPLRCQAQLLCGWHLTLAGDLAGALAAFREAASTAAAAGDGWQEAIADCSIAFTNYLVGEPYDDAAFGGSVSSYDRELVTRERRNHIWEPRSLRARLRVIEGEYDGARDDLERILSGRRELGDEVGIVNAQCGLARLEIAAGDLDAATAHAEGALEIAQHITAGSTAPDFWGTVAIVHAWCGRDEAAREAAGRALAVPTLIPEIERRARSAVGLLELSLGHAAAAHAEFRRAVEAVRATRFRHPGFFWFWHDALEASVCADQLNEAEELLGWLDACVRNTDHPPARASAEIGRALVAAAHGDIGAAVGAAEAALVEHERFDRPLHLARTLLLRGGVLRRAKQRRRARESLAAAARLFADCGALLWLARTERELDRTGLRQVADWELTPTEAQVAGLAAAGARNKEIAERLFMSVKTVEANLSRVYGKLGVRSRTELAGRLRR
jgi:DNA-binding CsgD family transcriptional regulator